MLSQAILLYTLYIYSVFYYLSKIFGVEVITVKSLFILIAINSFILYFPIIFADTSYASYFMVIYFIVLGIEIKLCFRQSILKIISTLLCFTINYFATRLLVIGLLSLYYEMHVNELIQQSNMQILINIYTFAFLTPYIYLSSKILVAKVVSFLYEDKRSIALASILLGLICIYNFIVYPTLFYQATNYQTSAIFQIKTGLFCLLIFILVMIAVFIYSMLKKATLIYENTSTDIRSANTSLQYLEQEIHTDYLTGFSTRNKATITLQSYLNKKIECYIIFIDIDGLKFVNEEFGHEEGDNYIKSVCDVIETYFKGECISRIGGDEFLIIGNKNDPEFRIQSCYRNVFDIRRRNYNSYETSISYGLTKVSKSNKYSLNKLIRLTDEKMYNFKKTNNKQRKS